ncbi:MAG: tetratricopeptide repeat protein [Gammaproteobacteria bacterium]|nr:tetratricopeptide repeat protein [Gammaproteobacteria bacterium]
MSNRFYTKQARFPGIKPHGLIAIAVLLISACTAIPDQASDQSGEMKTGAEQTLPIEKGEQETANEIAQKTKPVRPKIELSEDILYKLLVAEIAGHREQLDISVDNYLDLARETRDPEIISRATRVAIYARNDAAAKEAAQLWTEVDPGNSDAHQVLTVMAVREGNTAKALEHLEVILKSSGREAELSQQLWMVANLLSREKDKVQVKSILEELMAGHQDDPEILFAYAQVLTRLAELPKAREVLERVLVLAPENDNAAMAYVAVLNQQGYEDQSLTWLKKALRKNEDNFNLRIFYARMLTDLKRFEEARSQFEILAAQDPKNSDVLFSLGLLYLQANRLDDAESYFIRLSETKGHVDDASYYLGRISEERADLKKAGDWYRGVSSGNNYFDAQMRIGLLLGKQNKLEEARAHLAKIKTQSDQEKDILIQAEAEMLSEAKRYQDAMVVYDKALQDRHDADLLYSRAMLAEKMDRLDILEKDLRTILEKDPGNSQALNALGYTLADRTDRYDEAYELIKQALEISPNDYYVLDSMGWILYRQGRLDEAIEFLNKALAERNDPEIAAHLGEVLWVKGDKKAAQAVWDTALKQTPDDDKLRKVINRLNP